MQVSDVIFGLVVFFILCWVSIIALNQNNMGAVINNISARSQVIISDERYCNNVQEFELVKKEKILFENYIIIPKTSDANQLVLCVYKEKKMLPQ